MKRTILLVACMAIMPGIASASDRGSAEDQLACTPDVYRLCAGDIPDEDAITACLRQRKSQLSDSCRAVFSRPDADKPKVGGGDD